MKKPEMSQRLEMGRELTPRAQMIEEAKRFRDQIRHNPLSMRIDLLTKWYPELSKKDIEKLAE